jgi:hypothetical protein
MESLIYSEFLWGLVFGSLLSIAGAWAVAHFSLKMQTQNQLRLIKRLCRDTAKNVKSISEQFDETKSRTKLIYGDYLTLIDVEIGVYGRNREHLVLIPEDDAEAVRKFFTDVATRRAEVQTKLAEFERHFQHAEQVAAAGRAPEAARIQALSQAALDEAKAAADRLVTKAREADTLIARLAT